MRHRAARAAAALLAAAALAAGCGQADGALTVRDAHVAPHPAGTGPAGGFLVIENGTGAARRLLAVTSPECERVAIHRSVIEDGVARMVPQETVALPAGERVAFEPGGLHLMLMEPRALAPGDTVSLALQLDGGDVLAFEAEVRPAGGAPHGEHAHP